MYDREPAGSGPDDDRETIWGINRKDRPLFQVMTLVGGLAGSATLTALPLKYRTIADAPDTLALNILLGIGASFVAAGFISWGLLQIKELIMSIAYWIKQRNARNREQLLALGRDEGIAIGRDEGIAIGRHEGIAIGRDEGIAIGRDEGIAIGRDEGYHLGYDDSDLGKPRVEPSGKSDKTDQPDNAH